MSLLNIYNSEYDKLINGVELFRDLLPSDSKNASIHSGEEGRFVENLVVEFLRNSLPAQLEVASGFVVGAKDLRLRSGQIDVLVYDKMQYAPLMKYGDAVVVHDRAVIAAISIKKNIKREEITKEFKALSRVGTICGKNGRPKLYLGVFALDIHQLATFEKTVAESWGRIQSAYEHRKEGWAGNEMVNDLIVLNQFLIKKSDWQGKAEDEKFAKYSMCGGNDEHRNIYLQHLVNGIAKVFDLRRGANDSVLTHFPKVKFQQLGGIDLCASDRPPSR
jgi:hypothetical protein